MQKITDAAAGKWFSNFMMGLALLKNYNPFGAPPSLDARRHPEEVRQVASGLTGKELRQGGPKTPQQAIPGTSCSSPACGSRTCSTTTSAAPRCASSRTARRRAKSPSARTTPGIGWRNIIENMHKNATVAEWYKEHGRHEIFAGGKRVDLQQYEHSLVIRKDDAEKARAHSELPQNARDEKLLRKKQAKQAAEVRAYYEETVLKRKQKRPSLVQLG